MKIDIGRLHQRASKIFDRERLIDGTYRVVAFVLDSKARIITEGWNQYSKSHPVQKQAALKHEDQHKHFLHAEVHALTRLGKNLGRQHTLVVIRLGANKELRPGKPCKICESVIEQFGIEHVVHS